MIIHTTAYPRAGLVGNPSDGYFGKTIAFTFTDFSAKIVIYESPELEILPSRRDHSVFGSVEALVDDVHKHGYYGGFRLLKATIKRFADYTRENGILLDNRNFTLRYQSDIPGRVGLAGSSAIITACMRGLMKFYGVQIPKPILADLVLSVENDELSIPSGLQDRVAQAYEDLIYMDFDRKLMEKRGYGEYRVLSKDQLPNLYIGYLNSLAEGTEVTHSDLRARWKAGDKEVVQAVKAWASYAERVADLLEKERSARRDAEISELLNENFNLRRRVCAVSEGNIDLIESVRAYGASAKFAGSGGAIVGLYPDDATLAKMQRELAPKDIVLFRPTLCQARAEAGSMLAENPKMVF